MDNLYLIVKDILNTASLEDAKQKLYGLDGIDINSKEYYENIISSFVRKKDIILRRLNKEITYDLDNDIQDIWDIMFISQYIKKQWKIEQENIRQEINKLKSISPITEEIREQIASLNSDVTLINTYFQKLEKSSELSKVNLQRIDSINQNALDYEIKELKKAILVFQKLRDSFEHRNEKFQIGKQISINNEKNYFRVTIPSDYIDGFNKGRIIVKEDDRELIEIVDSLTYPILEKLDYDPKSINSFFYNVNPSVLSKLLTYCNNDIHELYKLPAEIFNKSEYYIDVIFKYYNMGYYSLEELAKFPSCISAFDDEETHESSLLEYSKKNNLPLSMFNKLSAEYLVFTNKLIPILEFLKESDIDMVKFFDSHNSRVNHLKNFDDFKRIYDYFTKRNFDVNEIIDINIRNADLLIKFIEQAEKDNISHADLLCILKTKQYIDWDSNRLQLLNDYLINKFGNNEHIADLYIKTVDIDDANDFIPLIDNILNKGFSIDELLMIDNQAFNDSKVLLNILNDMDKLMLTKEDILSFPKVLFYDYKKTLDFIIFLKENGIGLKEGYELPLESIWTDDVNESLNIYKRMLNKFGKEYVKKFPSDIYYDSKNLDKLIYYFETNGIDIRFILDSCEKDKEEKEQRFPELLWSSTWSRADNVIKLFELSKKYNISLSDLMKLPNWVCSETRFEAVSKLFKNAHDNGISVSQIADEMYRNYISTPEILNYFSNNNAKIDMSKLPRKLMNTKLNFQNIEFLLNRVNGDYQRLEEYPVEFFSCETNMLNELITNYNINICKSIFGVDNPKITSALVYANSVLSKIDSSFDFDSLNIDVNNIIHGAYNDTIKYSTQLTGNVINQEEYLTQFVYNDKNEKRDLLMMKELIITKFRNSSAHFRFKMIKDENGNIVDDKIYLYDEYNDGRKNFNLVVNLNDFVEIVRIVDITYQQQLNSHQNNSIKAM